MLALVYTSINSTLLVYSVNDSVIGIHRAHAINRLFRMNFSNYSF